MVSRVVEEVSNGVMDDLFQLHQEEEDEENHIPASQAALESLKRHTITELEQDLQCPICLEKFNISEETLQMPCKHCFHEECLKKWLSTDNTCPVCRQVLEDSNEPCQDLPTEPSVDLDHNVSSTDTLHLRFRLDSGEEFTKSFDCNLSVETLLTEIKNEIAPSIPDINNETTSLVMRNKETGEVICNLEILEGLTINTNNEINITKEKNS